MASVQRSRSSGVWSSDAQAPAVHTLLYFVDAIVDWLILAEGDKPRSHAEVILDNHLGERSDPSIARGPEETDTKAPVLWRGEVVGVIMRGSVLGQEKGQTPDQGDQDSLVVLLGQRGMGYVGHGAPDLQVGELKKPSNARANERQEWETLRRAVMGKSSFPCTGPGITPPKAGGPLPLSTKLPCAS